MKDWAKQSGLLSPNHDRMMFQCVRMINKLIIRLFHMIRRGDMLHLLVILYFCFVTDSLTTYFTFKDSNVLFGLAKAKP